MIVIRTVMMFVTAMNMITIIKAYKRPGFLSISSINRKSHIRRATLEESPTIISNEENKRSFDPSSLASTLMSLTTASLSATNTLISDSNKRQYAAAMTFRITWFVSQYVYRQATSNNNRQVDIIDLFLNIINLIIL